MYLNHWHLRTRPFANDRDPAFDVPSQSQCSALVRLRYALEDRGECALLIGPGGIGKSHLIDRLERIESVQNNLRPFVSFVFTQLSHDEMLAHLADRLCNALLTEEREAENFSSRSPLPRISPTLGELEQRLKENVRRGKRAVLVVNDIDAIDDPKTLRNFKSLLSIEQDGKPCLSIIFLGEGAVYNIFDSVPALDQRIEAKCVLEPFSKWETHQYIEARLKIAGAFQTVFETNAIPLIHDLTQGIPRQINRLCDLALLVGSAQKETKIEPGLIESLFEELIAV